MRVYTATQAKQHFADLLAFAENTHVSCLIYIYQPQYLPTVWHGTKGDKEHQQGESKKNF